MRSIQQRLGIGLASILLLVGLLLLQGSLWLLDDGLRRYHAGLLEEEAQGLLAALVRGPAGLQLDETRLAPAFQRAYSGRYFRIDFPEGRWRSRSLWDSDLPQPATAGLQADLQAGVIDQQLLVFRGDYQRFAQRLSITVASDYTPVLDQFARIRWLTALLGGGALLLTLLLQWLSVRRALRPLEQVRTQIAELQAGRLTQLDEQVPGELSPLVGQLNHLLRHTAQTLQRSRHGLGNLGHALKTPLAVLFSLLEREELRAEPALRRALREPLQQIEQRLARELGRARLAGEALPGAHFDCSSELPALCRTLALVHPHVDIHWQAPAGLSIPRDREDLLELLGNLLDNACKWADSQVLCSAGRGAEGYWLAVEDDGPGIAPERRREVIARGQRLDEQVAGHGLGLAIVRDIAEACGGTLELEDSPALGGLCARVLLPAAPASR
ncbi:sensor histidine kinase [Pseudomonas sp. NW5]|uniref:sensor histidine kinase n=1 Tax=Pseudomonas sp. NW5 TaxID=2934934 RepID=UPI002020C0AC|nr:sensor histidine kinase [Pseudomonas sp. NW5]MCL7462654.1 sensor histidine kinase [Pseudomonas sp. NW5]